MSELRFDGRTAVVTGAGGNPSLGRAHALLLARRGANVVVNDVGREPSSQGYSGVASAEAVAAEIRAFGGKAISDSHSVATEEGAAAIVQTALDAFGGIDILVNNAGMCLMASFDEVTSEDFRRHIDINLMGPVWMCRASWPHMRAKGYGRIVNTGSGAMAGFARQSAYAASKGGLFSLTRALAIEGIEIGIRVNTLHPAAFTRMIDATHKETSSWYSYSSKALPAELVSPVVAFLAHETCPVTGECFEAMGGKVSRVYLAQTLGVTDGNLSTETVAERWDEIMSGTAAGLIGVDPFDPSEWDLKPYQSKRP